MKITTTAALLLSLGLSGQTFAADKPDLAKVSPALEHYQQQLQNEVWKREALSPRDRSIATLAAMIARDQAAELPAAIRTALDNGVKPAEISETITHLAFYSGWGNAMDAARAAQTVYEEKGIGADQLPEVDPQKLPLDKEKEEQRQQFVEERFGKVAPGVTHYTTELLFLDLWLRPALAPRDRSLVTVSALVAAGKVEQVPFHLNRAMDNGLKQSEASELLTHLAFYAGWPNVFSALPVFKKVFEERTAG
ncbi:carboxymuconolactone decarboxylase family protein [Pokkaliibacter sp. CJK22405]|uniref:carboxymuconolactone decarboxylase family protein n=1 Tax=Pokkaliibacter sp. CJK22405 TaxID=3384615 RepID=UPI0039855B0B